jgi:LysR family glycine cleavage system transcriptional activator
MCRRTLPLNSLRAFEVAARHKSLAKAAEELSVTPGAVHHQVKSLEMLLGVTLFNRAGNNLTLTKAATAALPTLESAFDLLSLATEKIRQHTSNGYLSLAVCPSFAQKWLIPRIDRFRENFDRIELHISTSTEFPDLNNSEIDIAIGYGPEERFRYPGVLAERLMGDDVFPVCTPKYRDQRRLRSESDLLNAVLLHDDGALLDQGADWNSWFTAANVHGEKEPAGIRFDTIALALDAALLGQGVALGRRSLVADDLSAGRLVQPFSRSLTVNGGYFIGNLRVIAEQPRIIAFHEWIFSEVSLGKALAPRLAAMAG